MIVLTQTWYRFLSSIGDRISMMNGDNNPIVDRVRQLERSGRHVARVTWPEWSAERSFRCLLVLEAGNDVERFSFGAPTWPAAERMWKTARSLLDN